MPARQRDFVAGRGSGGGDIAFPRGCKTRASASATCDPARAVRAGSCSASGAGGSGREKRRARPHPAGRCANGARETAAPEAACGSQFARPGYPARRGEPCDLSLAWGGWIRSEQRRNSGAAFGEGQGGSRGGRLYGADGSAQNSDGTAGRHSGWDKAAAGAAAGARGGDPRAGASNGGPFALQRAAD